MSEQAQLFDESAFPVGRELLLPEEVQLHRFTGEQVRQNRERYTAIVRALAEGIGIRRICRAFAVSQHTVEGIREREPALVATEKADLLKTARRIVRMSAEFMEECLEQGKIAPGQIGVHYGIAVDKMIALEAANSGLAPGPARRELSQELVRQLFQQLGGPGVIDVESAVSGRTDNESARLVENPLQITGESPAAVTCVDTPDVPTSAAQPHAALSGSVRCVSAGQDSTESPRPDGPDAHEPAA